MKSISQIVISILPESNRFERIWKLAQVDFKKRYYNDKLGLLWAFINPTIQVLIYYVVFTYILKTSRNSSDNFALFIFSGLIFWMTFIETMKKSMKVLQTKRYLIENIQLNKIDLFLSTSLSTFLGFSFNILAYIVIALFLSVKFTSSIFILPVLILNTLMIGTGLGMILAIFYIYLKDINHIIDIFILLGFWSSGIFFPAESIYNFSPIIYYANPFVGILKNIRHILVSTNNIDFALLNLNFITGLALLMIGNFMINKYSHMAIEKA